MRKSNKVLIIIASIILIFAFLNPTRKDFAEHLGLSKDHSMESLSRKYNFIVFSVYEKSTIYDKKTYLAILKNFIKK